MRYKRGKADWIVRRLPIEPAPAWDEYVNAFPFFVHNLVPGIRDTWLQISSRPAVKDLMKDDLARMVPNDPIAQMSASIRQPVRAVVLNAQGVLLGALEANASGERAIDAMNPSPQTIRPDMTHRLAASLLKGRPYLLVTDADGKLSGVLSLDDIAREAQTAHSWVTRQERSNEVARIVGAICLARGHAREAIRARAKKPGD